MAHSQLPHYSHHMAELHRTRRRFWVSVGLLGLALTCLVALQLRGSNNVALHTVSGRVYSATTGAGIANVKLYICSAGTYAVTNGAGNWSVRLPVGSRTCFRYAGGGPAKITAPRALRNRSENAAAVTYENQVIGYDCYRSISASCLTDERVWDLSADSGYDFVVSDRSSPKPSPAPAKRPSAKAGSVWAMLGGWLLGEASAAADTRPPTIPANFQATVAGDNAIVNLSWEASSDDVGLKGYKLERSLDQTSWEVIGDSLQGTTYMDKSAGFGVHYYYRLSAVDQSGKTSGYAATDASTGDFSANAQASSSTTYTSDDNLATVQVPVDAMASDANCSVSTINVSKDTKRPGTKQRPLVVGPYALVCKTSGGDTVKDFLKPVLWSLDLKDKLKNLNAPRAYSFDAGGNLTLLPGSKFNAAGNMLQVFASDSTPVVVLADVNKGVSVNLIAAILMMGGAIVGVLVLILRQKQRSTYDNYLRKKYYNL